MRGREIERCAKEAGLTRSEGYGGWIATDNELTAFVDIVTSDYAMQAEEVREAIRAKRKEETTQELVTMAVNAEREACAALCFQMWNDSLDRRKLNHPDAEDCATAIRARGQSKPETLSPAEHRRRTNAPWNDKASY